MAILKPFRALRFDPAITGDLAAVVAPPYDVIDGTARDRLYARSPYNVVRLDPEPRRRPLRGGGTAVRGVARERCARRRGAPRALPLRAALSARRRHDARALRHHRRAALGALRDREGPAARAHARAREERSTALAPRVPRVAVADLRLGVGRRVGAADARSSAAADHRDRRRPVAFGIASGASTIRRRRRRSPAVSRARTSSSRTGIIATRPRSATATRSGPRSAPTRPPPDARPTTTSSRSSPRSRSRDW